MTGPVFVDTNVLVYRHDSADPEKQARADAWMSLLVRRRAARTSFQVLQEFYATFTRELTGAFSAEEARQIVRDLGVWRPVAPDLPLLERSWDLQGRYGLSWWDSLIVAAAQRCECAVLLTEDLQHGQLFGATRVVDPFRSPERPPAEVLDALAAAPDQDARRNSW